MTVEELRQAFHKELNVMSRHVVELSAYFTKAINEIEARLDVLEGKENLEQLELFEEGEGLL